VRWTATGSANLPTPWSGTGGGTADLGTLSTDGTGQPLNLNLDSSQELANGDAAAQYQAGYEAIVRGDYPFAEDQFRQFIALYPKDPQAPDATNWLGEALLQRQAYDEAVDVLVNRVQDLRAIGASARSAAEAGRRASGRGRAGHRMPQPLPKL